MTIIEYYKACINGSVVDQDDFRLFPFSNDCLIGFDNSNNLCVVIKSTSQSTTVIQQKTRLLSIECNVQLSFQSEGTATQNIVHIVRCFSKIEKEREMFLELIDAMIPQKTSDESAMETFRTLAKFFADKSEPSDGELIGLYAELDAVGSYANSINLADYWQSKDRLKFDFSFSDNLKLEVKATTKNFRTHHFKHEQLAVELFDIYVLSYMLRYDDEGRSLYDLIIETKSLLSNAPKKLTRVDSVLKNVSEERLKSFKFSPEYTEEKRHFYRASDIPRFPAQTPEGVANAEYDCDLENIPFVSDEDFFSAVKAELKEDNSNG